MDIASAFTYQFKDESWFKKLILLGLVSLIPVVGSFVLLGAVGQIIKRYINNEQILLPELDFGTQLSLGFKLFVVSLGYALPAIILQLPAQILPSIIPMMSNGNNDSTLITVITIITSCCMGIVVLYYIFIGFLLPIAISRVAIEENIGAGFKFGEIFSILKSNFVNYLIILIVGGIATNIIVSIGFLVCFVGLLLALPYAMSIQANLYAQAYKIALTKQPVP
jgi:hypothetical protein